ncbi:MAG: hypothetical protein R3F55_09025 [Alphaproteobacteria bacterium]
MKTAIALTACALAAGCVNSAPPAEETVAATAATPHAAAQAFYDAVAALPVGGVPDEAGRATLAPLVSPALGEALDAAAAAEAAHSAATAGAEPPLAEGDLFSSLYEGPTGYTVGDCVAAGIGATCPVALVRDDSAGTTAWTDTAVVVESGEGWRLADIVYGGDWDFAAQGRLTDALAGIAAAAQP